MSETTTKSVCEQIIEVTHKMGDTIRKQWEQTNDLKAAKAAIGAYGVAVNAAKTQLVYKKLTENTEKIGFFEEVEQAPVGSTNEITTQ